MADNGNHPGAGHRQRLRERFLEHGLESFTDDQVLELLLTLATPRQDCKLRARALLAEFGSLAAVLDAEAAQLARIKGIGPKNILGLKLIPAVARRYLENRLKRGDQIYDARLAAEHLHMSMRPLQREVFRVMLLDAHRRMIEETDVFSGTLTTSAVYPREVVATALAKGAAAVVCAHNHPSGEPKPSKDDTAITRQLYYACRGVGVELMDHIIVAGDKTYSFAAEGTLAALAYEYEALALEAN